MIPDLKENTDAIEREPTSRRRIAFKDCDAFGMLYNTRYLDYVLDARGEHLIDHYNIDFFEHARSGDRTFVIQGHQVTYLEPVRAHEEVLITTRLIDVEPTGVLVEGLMFDLRRKKIKFLQWTRMRSINLKTGLISELAVEEMDELRRTMPLDGIPDPKDYNGRVKGLRSR